eukprot:Selendium_serpulae@DN257_c0_g1_i1.p1
MVKPSYVVGAIAATVSLIAVVNHFDPSVARMGNSADAAPRRELRQAAIYKNPEPHSIKDLSGVPKTGSNAMMRFGSHRPTSSKVPSTHTSTDLEKALFTPQLVARKGGNAKSAPDLRRDKRPLHYSDAAALHRLGVSPAKQNAAAVAGLHSSGTPSMYRYSSRRSRARRPVSRNVVFKSGSPTQHSHPPPAHHSQQSESSQRRPAAFTPKTAQSVHEARRPGPYGVTRTYGSKRTTFTVPMGKVAKFKEMVKKTKP